jgi:hypothetical protein
MEHERLVVITPPSSPLQHLISHTDDVTGPSSFVAIFFTEKPIKGTVS